MDLYLQSRWLMTSLDARLAKAWDQGYRSGFSNAMRRMSDEPDAPTTENPYSDAQNAGADSPTDTKTYMTDIPGRSPQKKAHLSIGQAKSAISYNAWGGPDRVRGGKLYEIGPEGTRLLYDVPRQSLKVDLPWRKP